MSKNLPFIFSIKVPEALNITCLGTPAGILRPNKYRTCTRKAAS
jgi:hypothetical protein